MLFTAHNIRLDDGTLTKPDVGHSMEAYPAFLAARRVLERLYPQDRGSVRLADLGCLEGGYAVEFARMGFQVVGIEVRSANIAACNYVKARTRLPNLEFVQDDAQNIAAHGFFDAVFCCGLLYHLDKPKQFLQALSTVTLDLLILQTHFATREENPDLLAQYQLSERTENEGLPGRWFTEFRDESAFRNRETAVWSSWDNRRSFWIQREYLLQTLHDVGFDVVMEQYDGLGPDIAGEMLGGYYRKHDRSTFIGIKSSQAPGRDTQ